MTDIGPGITSTAERIFQQLVWNPVVTGALAALYVAVPWLNVPVVRDTINFIVQRFADWLYSKIRLVVDVTAIQLLNEDHQSAYDTASLKLKVVALDSGMDSVLYAQALADAQSALSRFTRFNQ